MLSTICYQTIPLLLLDFNLRYKILLLVCGSVGVGMCQCVLRVYFFSIISLE